MVFQLPEECKKYGFSTEGSGVHSSRTIMTRELETLLSSTPKATCIDDYLTAIIDENVLLKKTTITRKESFTRLKTLYSLDPNRIIFRALQDLWVIAPNSQPLLALLCAISRDKFLRSSTSIILKTPIGECINSSEFEKHIQIELPNFAQKTIETMSRNISSSWTQSGHLEGRSEKTRKQVIPTPPVVAYALLLGYLCGARGEGLFESPWVKILDTNVFTLYNLTIVAAQNGWLDYRKSGSVTDVSFSYLLRDTQENNHE